MVSTEGCRFFVCFSWEERAVGRKTPLLGFCCCFRDFLVDWLGWVWFHWVWFHLVWFHWVFLCFKSLLVSLLTLLVFTFDIYSFPIITSSTMQYLLFLRRRLKLDIQCKRLYTAVCHMSLVLAGCLSDPDTHHPACSALKRQWHVLLQWQPKASLFKMWWLPRNLAEVNKAQLNNTLKLLVNWVWALPKM